MALSTEAAAWLAEHGIGPLASVLAESDAPGDWTEALASRHPELALEDADALIGYALRARAAAAGGPGAPEPPIEPLGRRGRRRAASALRYRYRITVTFERPGGGRPAYRTLTIDSPGPLSPAELSSEAEDLADDLIDTEGYGLEGYAYGGYSVGSLTRVSP